MSLVAYTITAIERDVADAAVSGKQVIAGATCSMYIQPADTVVTLYDDAAGTGGASSKVTGANGQVTVYVEPGLYRVNVNGISSIADVQSISAENRMASKIVLENADEVDSSARINSELTNFESVILVGSFTILSPIVVPVNGELSGRKGRTFITCGAAFSGTDAIETNKNAIVKDLDIIGNSADFDAEDTSYFTSTAADPASLTSSEKTTAAGQVAALQGVGSIYGVYLKDVGAKASNLNITNFSAFAIRSTKNNTTAKRGIDSGVYNSRLFNNYGAVYLPEECEYMKFVGNTAANNIIGNYVIGGNNSFVGCKTQHNRVNLFLGNGLNDSHGEFTGGDLNHGKLASLISYQISNGEILTGMSIFDGGQLGIFIYQSRGLKITSSTLARCNVHAQGVHPDGGAYEGANEISGNWFSLTGATYQVYHDLNSEASNLKMSGNKHMEGDTWTYADDIINNESTAPVSNIGTISDPVIHGRPEDGGFYIGDNTQVGSVAIILPPATMNNSLISMKVKITGLFTSPSESENSILDISGYAASGGTWASTEVVRLGGKFYPVRFGQTAGGKGVIYIGEIDEQYKFAHLTIESLSMTTGAFEGSNYWINGWTYALVTSFESVTASNTVDTITRETTVTVPYSGAQSAYSGTVLKAHKVGDRVELSGYVNLTGDDTVNALLAILPTGYRPDRKIYLVSAALASSAYFDIDTNGEIRLTEAEVDAAICMDNVSFRLTQA